jgi:hypothetical protein
MKGSAKRATTERSESGEAWAVCGRGVRLHGETLVARPRGPALDMSYLRKVFYSAAKIATAFSAALDIIFIDEAYT